MARQFGGVKVTARPVPAQGPGRVHVIAEMEWEEVPIPRENRRDRVPQSPFAYQRDRTTPNFLDYAAYYVAGVLCERQGHIHKKGEWPCKRSLDFALTEVHVLAARNIPQPKQEKSHAPSVEESKESGRKSGKKSSNPSSRKSSR